MKIKLFGRGSHGSQPQTSIDPVIMAAATTLRLQTIVSREVAPTDAVVVTIGALRAGTKENVIPDEALIKLNVRTFDDAVRTRVLDAIRRIVNAESEAAGASKAPEFTTLDRYRMVQNDPDATRRVMEAFRHRFEADRVTSTKPTTASEDFGTFGAEWQSPAVFWFIGGTDPILYATLESGNRLGELPTNHNPRFAPVIHPTLETGVQALVVASQAWLST
jgi:hippurate hydrolase